MPILAFGKIKVPCEFLWSAAAENWEEIPMFGAICFLQKKAAALPTQEAVPKEEEEIVHEDNEWGRKPLCTGLTLEAHSLLGGRIRLHEISDNS